MKQTAYLIALSALSQVALAEDALASTLKSEYDFIVIGGVQARLFLYSNRRSY